MLMSPTGVMVRMVAAGTGRDHGFVLPFEASEQIPVFQTEIKKHPSDPRLHCNLGTAFQTVGDFDAAEKSFKTALRLRPEYPIAMNNLGGLFIAKKLFQAAIPHLKEAARLDPKYPNPCFNLGICFQVAGEWEQALEALNESLIRCPSYLKALCLLGTVYSKLGRPGEAQESFLKALKINPRHAESWLGLGMLRIQYGNGDAARVPIRNAYLLKPTLQGVRALDLMLDLTNCDWTDYETRWEAVWQEAQAEIQSGRKSNIAPYQAFFAPWPPERLLQIARGHSEELTRLVGGKPFPFKHPNTLTADGRLRVGYISTDLRNHPVGHFTRGLFAAHDRARVEVFIYSYCPDDGSPVYSDIKASADVFRDISDLSYLKAAKQIQEDGIHILVDLTGHTGQTRMEILALRPAPVQVSWLGFVGTSGANFIDWLLVDKIVAPPESAKNFVEKLCYLDDTSLLADGVREIAEKTPSRTEEGLPEEGFVFCVFNKACKIEPVIFGLWMQILKNIPNSILWFSAQGGEVLKNLKNAAQSAGVDPERMVQARWVTNYAEHLARHRLADLFLDTHIFNAHTGAVDALVTGLPVLSWPGETTVSRVGASLLHATGFPDMLVQSGEEYVQRATELATDPAKLKTVRDRLTVQLESGKLFSPRTSAAKLEKAYFEMWEQQQ